MPKPPPVTPVLRPLAARITSLEGLLGLLYPVPDAWLLARADTPVSQCLPCTNWADLIGAWRRALKWVEGLDITLSVMMAAVTSTKSVGTQLWVKVIGPAGCGKSTLCEALSVNAQYVVAKSTFRGFHSGFSTNDGTDHSLIGKLNGKTFIVKDGDTLLQSPNLGQILSEGRDLFDTVSRSDYRTGKGKDWSGVRITWLLCGTSSLRLLDESELGERFLDCVIMEGIDDDLEDEILWRAVNREANNIGMEADGEMTSHNEPAMVEAMQLTGGYVDHLRENATRLLGMTTIDREHRHLCTRLGKFTSYMRARPSKKQDEESERELAARLTVQLVRLAMCLAVVLNKDTVDDEVVRRVHKVAMDTSRGITLQIVTLLSKAPLGMEARGIGIHTSRTEDGIRKHLRFLKQIGVVEINNDHIKGGAKTRANCWRLTPRIEQLYKEVTSG